MTDLNLEPPRIRQSFDRAAATYDGAAALQRRVADRLLCQLPALQPQHIVDAGCGTGYGSAALRARFPLAHLTGLDLAPGMLAAARQRSDAALICADAQALPLASACADLLWSSLMLQWCNRLDLAFADFRRTLRGEGLLTFSTFGPATLHELRASFADGRTHVSRFPDVEELRRLLMAAGFAQVELEREPIVVHYPEVRTLMQELKQIGAHNATSGRARGLTGKRGWQKMLANYETLRTAQGLPATYEVIYVLARV